MRVQLFQISPQKILVALLWLASLAPSVASAQRVEVTPFVGTRFGGQFTTDRFLFDEFLDLEVDDGESLGIVLDFRISRDLYFELNLSRQETALEEDFGFLDPGVDLFPLDVNYYHAGILYQWAPGQIRPFVVFSLGATHFSFDTTGLDDLARFSASAGGGVKILFNNHLGLRFEVRAFSTLIDEGDEVFCDFLGDCYGADGTYLIQGEVRAGVVLAF